MKFIGGSIVSAYQWLNRLSIDVCLGALAGGIMATRYLDVDPGWAYWIVLPLTVWLIYTADHLIDGWKIKRKASHQRHIFHQDYRRKLIFSSSLILILTAFFAFVYLPDEIIIFGSILGIMAVIYLIIVLLIPSSSSAILFQKEVFVALFYTAGIWGPVLVIKIDYSYHEYLAISLFFFLAFAELILLSLKEINADKKDGQRSIPIVSGIRFARVLFLITGVYVLLASTLLILSNPSDTAIKAGYIFITMQVGLFVIFFFPETKNNSQLQRSLGEAIFFLPALILI